MDDFIRGVKSEIDSLIEHYRTRPFVDAVMACAALVATADGEVSLAERVQRDRALEKLAEPGAVDVTAAAALFDELGRQICEDPQAGQARAWSLVDAIESEADDKFRCLLVRVACAVAITDGELSSAESQCIDTLCEHLGITRESCGV